MAVHCITRCTVSSLLEAIRLLADPRIESFVMTMIQERTRSVVQTEKFLRDIARDKTLPAPLRLQAEGLLRHYPTADDIWLAGKLEARRRTLLLLLEEQLGSLPPELGLWLVQEPLFCDSLPDFDTASKPTSRK